MWNFILSTVLFALSAKGPVAALLPQAESVVLASHEISLENRQPNAWVNNVFRENILLTVAYGRKIAAIGQPVNWDEVNKPFTWTMKLGPDEIFSFHNLVLPKYAGKAEPWNEIHYYTSEGFLSDGNLIGDGVCHLASLLAWTAKDAGLSVEAPTNHNFAAIPDVPKEEGVAIYYDPHNLHVSGLQNLYIHNTKDVPVEFVFGYDGSKLEISVRESLQ